MSGLSDSERVERARQARRALEFLTPAFDAVVAAYTERLETLAAQEPWAHGKITALANATRIAREVHGQIAALVHDGEDARANLVRVEAIERLTPAKRRLLNIGAF